MVDLITLNEAINQLMGEPERSPQQEIGRLIVYQNQLYWLAKKHAADISKLPKKLRAKVFSDELVARRRRKSANTLAMWPTDDFIDRLGVRDPDWPPFLVEWHDAAANVSREISEYDRRYTTALNTLLKAGREGAITFYERLTETSETKMIPPDHFLNNVTIDGDRRNLIPSAKRRGAIPGYQRVPICSDIPTFYDVEIEANANAAQIIDADDAGPVASKAAENATEPKGPGRPPEYPWPDFEREVWRVLKEKGVPSEMSPHLKWRTQADVIRYMRDWCREEWKRAPSDAAAKSRVGKIIKNFLAETGRSRQ
jgi:hypothetical protein